MAYSRKESVAALAIPVLTTAILLYRVVALLQVALLNRATLWIAGPALLGSLCVGVVAAFGPRLLRVAIIAGCVLVLFDTSFSLVDLFLPHAVVSDG